MSTDPQTAWLPALLALQERPAGLFTDVDGTISPIAPTPDEASVLPEAREALVRLSRTLSVVAAITGRASARAREMVGAPGVLYVGNHGLEELAGGRVELLSEARPHAPAVARVLAEATRALRSPGVLVEDKGVTGSVHYRLAPDPGAALREILVTLRPLAEREGLALHEGRMVVEVRPPVALGKGAAARRLVDRHGLRGCVFLGDDVTDTDAFRTLGRLREERGLRSVSVGVLSAETPPLVAELSDLHVEGVEGVVRLLTWLADNLQAA